MQRIALTIVAILLIVAPLAKGASAQELFIYPSEGQSQEQLDKDRYECHLWAVQNTGYDPSKPQTASQPAPPQNEPSQGGVVRGGARGAAVGAVGGAIGGDAGKGAAIGAATGALVGGMRRNDQRRRQAQEQQQQAAASAVASDDQRGAYNRAITACLQGRGYTVN
jgi:hypothetical protein